MKRVTLIGSGNVASHLATALHHASIQIVEVYSRNLENAEALAQKVQANPCNSLVELSVETDLYIIAVSDKSIAPVAAELPQGIPVTHTSGSIAMQTLERTDREIGIFYPLQTFTKEKTVDWSTIPFCIEASNEALHDQLFALAQLLSKEVYSVDSEQRAKLHLAAVFACNFSNHMYAIAAELLEENGLDLKLLHPLLLETAAKATAGDPAQLQTGPAIRKDDKVLQHQLEALSAHPNYQKIYTLISDSIQQSSDT